ncbi:hypothetical protein B484DRAFT_415467 [Ochromonadaceae sp. CCMP2298]|nr:hypothetical protein B484DRAFT_415467 [Ochromonadaceae sp. CCMP2298]|mmetsp:Transcript_25521/g.57681  ORF Transcript_25521/g.57681 Transcript_25521/m.57681 type:complete len:209 (+) Transcript_25521:66-692(+)
MVSYLNALSTLLAVVSLCFLLAAMASWSADQDTVESNFWVKGKGDQEVYFALRAVTIKDGLRFKYSDCSANSDICDKCEQSGKTAMAFMVLAWVVCLVNVICNGASISMEGAVKWAAVGASLAAALFSMASFASFMASDCYDKIDDTYEDVEYGPSAGLVLASLCLLVVGTLLSGVAALMPAAQPMASTGNVGAVEATASPIGKNTEF